MKRMILYFPQKALMRMCCSKV